MTNTAQSYWLRSYHLAIALMGLTILLISNGMVLSGLTPFRPEFAKVYGWTMQDMTFGDLVSFLVVGGLSPFLGIVMDRVGVKRLMMLGGVVLSVAYFGYGRVQSLSSYYLMHALLGVGIALAGLVPTSRLIGRWFNAKRGTAMGIALAGSSLASFVFPPLAVKFIAQNGITGAFDRLAIAGLVLTALVALFVYDRPEERQLSCYGDAPLPPNGVLPGLDFSPALKSMSFWCLAFGAGATFFSMLGTLFNLLPHMLDLGFDRGGAVRGIQVMLTAALIGKFGFGLLSDYVKPKTVYLCNLLVMGFGALLLARAGQHGIWVALLIFGLGWGGLYTMLQLLAVQSFGMRSAGRLMGTIAIFDAVGGGLGSIVMGIIRTHHGSYTLGFYLMFVLIVLAIFAATQVRQVYHSAEKLSTP
jgi:nitrate/nitrite transporter NarK